MIKFRETGADALFHIYDIESILEKDKCIETPFLDSIFLILPYY